MNSHSDGERLVIMIMIIIAIILIVTINVAAKRRGTAKYIN